MPEFLLSSPEGKQYRVTGPEGATPADAFKRLQQQLGGGAAAPPEPAGPTLTPYAESMRSTTTQANRLDDPKANFDQRAALERSLKAAGKDPRQNPEWQRLVRGQGEHERAVGEDTARFSAGGEAALPVLGRAAMGIGRGVGDMARKVMGTEARQSAEALRGQTLETADRTIGQNVGEAARRAATADAAARARSELATRQPGVAAERSGRSDPGVPMLAERQQVLADLRSRSRALEQEHRAAGMSTEEARRAVGVSERQIRDAEGAVADIERDLLAQPGMTADEFGQRVRAATQQLHDKYSSLRQSQSGFSRALSDAGDTPIVNTDHIFRRIGDDLEGIRNPQLQRVLSDVRSLIVTEGKNELTLKSAESLRKYLDGVVRSKQFGDLSIDKETTAVVKQIKKVLVESMTSASPAYKEALSKWSTLSRPLNVVERKGALRKVLDVDPVSTDYALSEAQVVGQVIRQSRAGNQALGRLLQESPELKDSARLYFTQDLFGKETVPTAASLRTWLKTNEGALRQSGLYDEFRNMKVARESAQIAVQEARGARAVAGEKLKGAESAERAVKGELEGSKSLRDRQSSVIEDLERQSARNRAGRDKEAAKRAGAAEKRLESTETGARAEQEVHLSAADKYRRLQTELKASDTKDIPGATRRMAESMRKDGQLSDEKYEAVLRQIASVENTVNDAAVMKRRMLQVGAGLAATAGVGSVYSKIKGLFN